MTTTERNILIGCGIAAAVVLCVWLDRRAKARPTSKATPPETWADAGVATFGVPTPFGWQEMPFAHIGDDGPAEPLGGGA